MRLLDQVAASTREVSVQKPSGEVRRFPGAASNAHRIASTPLRYVLDQAATNQCWAFILANEGMLDPRNHLLRGLSEHFWLEWFQQGPEADGAGGLRAGALFDGTNGGRRGSLQSFWEVPGHEPDMAQALVEFDLDQPLAKLADQRIRFTLEARSPGPVSAFLRHLIIRLNDAWLDELASRGDVSLQRAVRDVGSIIWRDLVFALGFSVLLSSGEQLNPVAVSRERLNLARLKQGRPALLDHIEVTMRLARAPSGETPRAHDSGRSAPRLHYVRGHMVHREGKVFWRSSHLRGDRSAMALRRTVNVKGASDGAGVVGVLPAVELGQPAELGAASLTHRTARSA